MESSTKTNKRGQICSQLHKCKSSITPLKFTLDLYQCIWEQNFVFDLSDPSSARRSRQVNLGLISMGLSVGIESKHTLPFSIFHPVLVKHFPKSFFQIYLNTIQQRCTLSMVLATLEKFGWLSQTSKPSQCRCSFLWHTSASASIAYSSSPRNTKLYLQKHIYVGISTSILEHSYVTISADNAHHYLGNNQIARILKWQQTIYYSKRILIMLIFKNKFPIEC